jgi:15-cis-phytoene synthase
MAATWSQRPHVPDAVRDAARSREPDRYLAALLAPRSVRADLIALAAFSAELHRVRDVVREPMMGQIRLQWWRDALPALARGEQTANPVADALGAAMRRHNLTPAELEPSIEARSLQLQEAREEGAEAGAEATVFKAALLVLGLPAAPASDALCAQAGVAYGVARGAAAPGGRVDRGNVARARAALAAASGPVRELGPRALPAFLPLVMVEPYLHVLEQRDAGHVEHFAHTLPLRRVWRIWRAHRRGRV